MYMFITQSFNFIIFIAFIMLIIMIKLYNSVIYTVNVSFIFIYIICLRSLFNIINTALI